MLRIFLYFLMLLLILFLSLNLLLITLKKAPKKIKIFTEIIISLIIIETISLIILTLISKQINVIYFKNLVFLRFIYIPLMIWNCFYIFWRNFKVNFNFSYVIMAVIWTIYIIILKITDTKINLSEVIGYSISLNNQLIMDLIYIGILVFLLLVCKINFNKNYINKIGMNYTMGTIMIIIFEMILKILKVEIFPYSLIGTVVVLWLSIYSYDSFKKNN